jgi:hypothetical protein
VLLASALGRLRIESFRGSPDRAGTPNPFIYLYPRSVQQSKGGGRVICVWAVDISIAWSSRPWGGVQSPDDAGVRVAIAVVGDRQVPPIIKLFWISMEEPHLSFSYVPPRSENKQMHGTLYQ